MLLCERVVNEQFEEVQEEQFEEEQLVSPPLHTLLNPSNSCH